MKDIHKIAALNDCAARSTAGVTIKRPVITPQAF